MQTGYVEQLAEALSKEINVVSSSLCEKDEKEVVEECDQKQIIISCLVSLFQMISKDLSTSGNNISYNNYDNNNDDNICGNHIDHANGEVEEALNVFEITLFQAKKT